MTGDLRPLGPEWDGAWDALTGTTPDTGFMQGTAWAHFKRAEGYTVQRYGWFPGDSEALRGGATVYTYPAGANQPAFAVCPQGPVLPWSDDPQATRAALRALLGAVQNDFPDAIGLRVEPPLPAPRPSVLRNWQRAPLDLAPVQTLVLDIAQSDENLLSWMHPKGRYNLRLSGRHGVAVRSSEEMRDLRPFYDLFAGTARRQEFFAEPYGFFLNLGATLFPRRAARLFFAHRDGATLAAALVVFHGDRATYLYGGSSLDQRPTMPCYALHHAIITYAREQGGREYDWWGCDPFGQAGHPYAGFSQFKRQWGGEARHFMGAQDCLFYDRLADHLVRRLGSIGQPAPSGDKRSV